MNHEEERQLLMRDLELLIDELKPEHRLKMLSIVMRFWAFIEKVESDGVIVSNDHIRGMIAKLRDR
jgi:hypothetical protein